MQIKADYYFIVILITVVLSCAMVVLIMDNRRLGKNKKRLCIVLPVLIALAGAAEYFVVILNGAPENTRVIHTILKVFELSLSPFMVFCLITAFNGYENGRKILPIAVGNCVMQVISGFTGFLFYFDSNNVYQHNDFYWIYTVIYVVCGIIFFSECVRFSRSYQNQNVLSLIAILAFLVFGLSIHNVFISAIRVDWLTLAIAYSMFYSYYNTLVEQTDSLTQLLDRKSYDIEMESLKKKVTIIMFDVDEFKKVNDDYGHDMGDVCLKTVAKAILNNFSAYAYCYRIGGDEFCAVTKKNVDISRMCASFHEELKQKRTDTGIVLPDVSIGYALFEPGDDIRWILKIADNQMYKEKQEKKQNY